MKLSSWFVKCASVAILALFFSNALFGQKEANIWYFGFRAGMDLNGNVPVALTDGVMTTNEGCASIADTDGKLLFYTDGVTVWNRNHQPMPNGTGLWGNYSTTQSGVIVPQPGNDSIYYVLTNDASAGSNGFRYSRVNMNLDGGMGDVEQATKNTHIHTPTSEKVTATRHANGRDIWVITHGWNNANFYAYLVTPTGFSLTPVVSTVGGVHSGPNSNTLGQLKASPNGTKLASCTYTLNLTQLFDFNKLTGVLSNPITLPRHNNSYGCEFSPDGKKLYISQYNPGNIFQYDISSNDSAKIVDSETLIYSSAQVNLGSLQLASNGKIYVARMNQFDLGVINNPNELGTASNYVDVGFNLAGKKSWLGLPNFISNYTINIGFEITANCQGQASCFEFTGNPVFDSLVWNFGDGSVVKSLNREICHIYTEPGNYEVDVYYWKAGAVHTTKKTIKVLPSSQIVQNFNECAGFLIQVGLNIYNTTGNYIDTLTSVHGCDSIVITNLIIRQPGKTINVFTECEGFSVTVGSKTYNTTGVYTDILNCADTNVTDLTILPLPVFEYTKVDSRCSLEIGSITVVNVEGKYPYVYEWSTGETDSFLLNITGGTYSLMVTDDNGCTATEVIEVDDVAEGCEWFFYIPNAFSPNGDGENDLFGPVGFNVKSFSMNIFTRWGEQLFSTTEGKSWDGRYLGKVVPNGSYIYVIEILTRAGDKLHYQGQFQVIW